jgi:hypothetical protein
MTRRQTVARVEDDLPTWSVPRDATLRSMRAPAASRVIEERREPRPLPPLRLLPPEPLRPRQPGVIPHPDEVMADNKKVLADLLAIMADEDVRYVLIGGLVTGLYGKDRATVDVDMLIPRRAKERLVTALAKRRYVVKTSEDMIRAYKRGLPVADLVVREANAVLRAASAKTEPAVLLGLPVDVVPRGAFVALKFHAAISPTRQVHDRFQDVTDIASVIARGFTAADERLAKRVAAKIYEGADKELAVLIDSVRHGRAVKI